MGSSARKKKEKKKDFQKAKLKVGKTKAKASNFTDTSFKSKAIVMSKQSLLEAAPDPAYQFKHNLSLAATSKSENQRREALAYLTGKLSADPPFNPLGSPAILDKTLPLISDRDRAVRAQLLKLFRALPPAEVRSHAERIIMYVRAGMTNLSPDVNADTLGVLDWLLDVAGDEVVACHGGWVKPLKCFFAMLGWSPASSSGNWSSAPAASLRPKDAQSQARQIVVLARFLDAGLKPEQPPAQNTGAYWDHLTKMPRQPNPFAYLNLFGPRRDEDGGMYADRESRQSVFHKRFLDVVVEKMERAKKDGGALGRAGATLDRVLERGMNGFDPQDSLTSQDLLHLW